MTKQETIQVLQSIEDRAIDFPYMTACDWVAIAAAKRHLENSLDVEEMDLEKEIDKIWNPRFNLGWDEKSLLSINHEGFTTIAKYFYELGLKTQKPAFETDNSIGSPDYERGFKHGRDFQTEIDTKCTDVQKVINYLINEKGYPINTQGDIPSYEETFKFALNALKAQKGE